MCGVKIETIGPAKHTQTIVSCVQCVFHMISSQMKIQRHVWSQNRGSCVCQTHTDHCLMCTSSTTLNTKGPVGAGCCRSQLIESCLEALIANRLAAKKHFGSTLKCCCILYIILDVYYVYFMYHVMHVRFQNMGSWACQIELDQSYMCISS